MANLKGLKVAILVEDGFEQVELAEPRKALGEAGAETHIVSPKPDTVRGCNFTDWGDEFPVDVNLDQALPAGFDIPVFNREMTGLFGRTRAKARQTARGLIMERRRFGSTKHEVAVIGQGSWYLDSGDRASAIAALRQGLDLGMTHIDTAEFYGVAEDVVGEAISGRRDEVFLVSKVIPGNASRSRTIAACERSLARLRTDRLDCYLLHWRGQYPLEDTIAAFEQLEREGKILSWGMSNFDVSDLEEAWEIAGEGRLVCNQVLYHLQERAIEHAVIPWCEKHGVAVVGYSPFGHGDFPGSRTKGGRVLEEIAAAHKATPRQVALRFLVRWPSLFTIPKASSPDHAAENAGAGELRLTETEIARIDEAFPRGPRPRRLPML